MSSIALLLLLFVCPSIKRLVVHAVLISFIIRGIHFREIIANRVQTPTHCEVVYIRHHRQKGGRERISKN